MSLTSFVGMPEVKDKLKSLRPKLSRKLSTPLKVDPRSRRYVLAGTAFDYLLRFELQRRAPHAISERWVAERVPEIIWGEIGQPPPWMLWGGSDYPPEWDLEEGDPVHGGLDLLADVPSDQYMPPKEVAKRAFVIVENAKKAMVAYVKAQPTAAMQAELAAHAIKLAKLDSVCRTGRLEPGFGQASPEDVQDLIALLSITPFDDLLHDKVLLLNPAFGQASQSVGGADADLITGDLLVDFKTTKSGHITAGNLDQILGYFLLARKQHTVDPTFPEINRLGLYFCRHGYLWTLEASVWTSNPAFREIEQWFFRRADEVFGASTRASR
ncbi:MAG: hypothetical protein ACRETC_06950 [Gammaproteobacteria bacterium]